jgi:peptidoglycan/LPS O-acetylase OafA/YrhL
MVLKFFVISGFVIPLSLYRAGFILRDYPTFIRKRVLRLYPPFLVTILIILVYSWGRKLGPYYNGLDTAPDLGQIVLNLFMFVPFVPGAAWLNDVFWTLCVEMQFYLAAGLLFPLWTSSGKILRLAGYLICLLPGLWLRDNSWIQLWIPLFLPGTMVFLASNKLVPAWEACLVILVSLLAAAVNHPSASLVAAFATAIAIAANPTWHLPWLQFYGKTSYSLYLLHTIFGFMVMNLLRHEAHNWWSKGIVFLLAFATTTLLSTAMYVLVERRSQRWSSRVRFTRGQARGIASSETIDTALEPSRSK